MEGIFPTLIANCTGAAVLLVLYGYLYLRHRNRFLLFFTAAWTFYLARMVLLTIQESFHPPFRTFLTVLTQDTFNLTSAVFLVLATRTFIQKKRLDTAPWAIMALFALASPHILERAGAPGLLHYVPMGLFLAVAFTVSGRLFSTSSVSSVRGVKVFGGLLILWGMFKLLSPFLLRLSHGMFFVLLANWAIEFALAVLTLLMYLEQTRQAAAVSESTLHMLFDGSRDLLMLVEGTTGRIRDANQAAVKAYGYSSEELRNLTILELLEEGELPTTRNMLEAAPSVGVLLETNHRRKDGSIFPVEMSARSVEAQEGTLFFTISRDISNRISERESLDWELKTNAALAQAAHAYFAPSPNPTDAVADAVIQRSMELTSSDLGFVIYLDADASTPICPVLVVNSMTYDRKTVGAGFLDEFRPLFDFVLTQKSGILQNDQNSSWPVCSVPLHRLMFTPVLVEGSLVGQVVLANSERSYTPRDLLFLERLSDFFAIALHRQRAASEEEQIRQQLVQSQRMESLGKLVGGIAHDLNNILTAIQGGAELLKLERDPSAKAMENLEEIGRAVTRAATLIRQLLLFSRQESMQLSTFNLNNVIADLTKMLKRIVRANVQILQDPAPDLFSIRADRINLDQVIMNLVLNAHDAMPERGIITLRTENRILDEGAAQHMPGAHPGRFVCLTVTDNGSGIPPEVLNRIFEPFFTTKTKGTGLGLSVVLGIVTRHGGWIHVESTVGKGTQFQIYLPALEEEAQPSALPAPTSRDNMKGKSERVLLVEDEGGVRAMAAAVLTKNGYQVFEAASANEALTLFRREGGMFDLIFCDVVLPDVSGPALVEKLLEIHPGLPVLFTSGYLAEEGAAPSIQDRGFELLVKPYTLESLLSALRRTLGDLS